MKSIISGRWAAQGNIQDVTYNGTLANPNRTRLLSNQNPINFSASPICAAGDLSKISVIMLATPASLGLTGLLFTLLKNGGFAASVSILGTNLTGTIVGPITYAAGDTIGWTVTPSPYFPDLINQGTCDIITTAEFDSVETGVSIYFGMGTPYSAGNGTTYRGLFNVNDRFGDILGSKSVVSVKGNITRYNIILANPPQAFNAGASNVYNLVLDGVVQDGTAGTVNTTITIGTAGTTGIWTGVLSLDPAIHNLIQVRAIHSGYGASPDGPVESLGCKFIAATEGQWWIGGYRFAPPTQGAISYQTPSENTSFFGSWGTVQADKTLKGYLTRFFLSGYKIWRGSSPGLGKSWKFSIVKNGIDVVAPTVTLADTNTIATTTDLNVVQFDPGDDWSIKVTPTNTPGILIDGVAWAFTATVISPLPPDLTGLYFVRSATYQEIGHDGVITPANKHDKYYNRTGTSIGDNGVLDPVTIHKTIPSPTIRTALIGE